LEEVAIDVHQAHPDSVTPRWAARRRSTGGVVRRVRSRDADLAIHLVGRFAVRSAGERLTGTDVGSRKARILLALLAMERNRLVRRDRIVDVVWGSDLPRDPAHNVATMVSRMRRTLGVESIVGHRAGYRLGNAIGVDLDDAEALVNRAETLLAGREPLVAHTAVRRALRILGAGGVLEDEPYETWAEPAHSRHRALLRRARHGLATSALRLGASAAAESAAASALAADHLDEAACRLLMQAYDAAGEPVRALDIYQRFRETLGEELGLDPAPATHDLYIAILRGRAAPRDART
jgi:DNA-binding SARP family transcriptional activator